MAFGKGRIGLRHLHYFVEFGKHAAKIGQWIAPGRQLTRLSSCCWIARKRRLRFGPLSPHFSIALRPTVSKQRELVAHFWGDLEKIGTQRPNLAVQTEPTTRRAEAIDHDVGHRPLAHHAEPEPRVALLAAPRLADPRH